MSTLDGDWEIFVMDADGGNLRQLTENSVDDRGPAWSPDVTRIAFVSNRDSGLPRDTEIYVMNADGSDQQRITEKSGFECGIDWHP
jgi:Tol biopolymer transport system component